jgi:hypothetical protein
LEAKASIRLPDSPFQFFIDNPYLIAYEMLNGLDKKFITSNITATYKLTKQFDVMLRSG